MNIQVTTTTVGGSPYAFQPWPCRVPGREDPARVIDVGPIGNLAHSVQGCLVLFEETGECTWYLDSKVKRV
jgi:hypothetical protein